jgi:hypothetical protein
MKVVGLWWFDMPMVLFEISVCIVLVDRGLGPAVVRSAQKSSVATGSERSGT